MKKIKSITSLALALLVSGGVCISSTNSVQAAETKTNNYNEATINLSMTSTQTTGNDIVDYAKTLIGNPYVWGGTGQVISTKSMAQLSKNITDPDYPDSYYKNIASKYSGKLAFDCSGFTQYVYKHFNYDISRTSKAQATDGIAVSKKNLKPGDLVFFGSSIHHVGIYVGNGKFIESPDSGSFVRISELDNRSDYNTARRIIK